MVKSKEILKKTQGCLKKYIVRSSHKNTTSCIKRIETIHKRLSIETKCNIRHQKTKETTKTQQTRNKTRKTRTGHTKDTLDTNTLIKTLTERRIQPHETRNINNTT